MQECHIDANHDWANGSDAPKVPSAFSVSYLLGSISACRFLSWMRFSLDLTDLFENFSDASTQQSIKVYLKLNEAPSWRGVEI